MKRNDNRTAKQFERYKSNKREILNGTRRLPYTFWRKLFRPLLRGGLWLKRKLCGFSVEVMNDRQIEFPERKSIIFAVTHIGKFDVEIVNEQIKEQFFLVAADFVNTYGNINGLLLNLSGIVYVDERDREDKANTKKLMINLLRSGKNIMIFPEGTWNFSENEIITDIAYGTAEAAIVANAVILPIALEQYGGHFVICEGDVINPAELNADKSVLTTVLRDTLATLKWKILESRGVYHRKDIPVNYWADFIRLRRSEWKGYLMEEQIINCYIPKSKLEYWSIQKDLGTWKVPLWYKILEEER